MKIAHIGLTSAYTEGMTYQDNQLVEQNVRDGQETLFISQNQKYDNGMLIKTDYEDIILKCGARLIRLPYVHIINDFISEKIIKVRGLYDILESFKPDVILYHSLSGVELLTAARYAKAHQVTLYADSHADSYNSGTNFISYYVLHRFFYRHIIKKALPFIEKVLCVGSSVKRFALDTYKIPEEKTEYFPLGGNIPTPQEYADKRKKTRDYYGIKDKDILFLHTGKINVLKRTPEMLRAFGKVRDDNFRLFIVGSLAEEIKKEVLQLVNEDNRVSYLGWKNSEELVDLLCAADVYLQPGSVSATLQNAMCCCCAIMCQPRTDYKFYLGDAGLFVQNEDDIWHTFEKISANQDIIPDLQNKSFDRAKELLDYKKLAARLYR